MKIGYKRASISDIKFIQNLNKKYLPYSDHVSAFFFVSNEIHYQDYFLLLYNGKPVGAVDFSNDGFSLDIEAIAIQKPYQRKGLGRLAIELGEKLARKYGCDKIFAGSYCIFKAKGFYESCGFSLIESGFDGERRYWDFEKRLRAA